MKKFMPLVVVTFIALLSGCASPNSRSGNPHFQNAATLAGTAAGATLGYKQAGNVGGVIGGVIGYLGMKGLFWEPPEEPNVQFVTLSDSQIQGLGGSQTGAVSWARTSSSRKNTPKKEPRLTVENYLETNKEGFGPVPEDCRTGNWGMDSKCLDDAARTLAAKQYECVAKKLITDPVCLKNPGILAGEFSILAKALGKRQEQVSSGTIPDKFSGN